MVIDIDALIVTPEPEDLSSCSLTDLRTLRDGLQDVENGVSYARRMVQGRLDTVAAELERRRRGDDEGLIARLPDALASHTRGPGMPRPMPTLDPPDWADRWVEEFDSTVPIAVGDDTPEPQIVDAFDRLSAAEAELSGTRRELHRRIDRVQNELVRRYRDGASVDDLLRG